MKIPFSSEQFLGVFTAYNQAVWPLQLILFGLALAAVYFVLRRHPLSDRLISTILGVLWIWMGAVYHLTFFTAINPAAFVFGGVFIGQGILFLGTAYKDSATYGMVPGWRTWAGALMILYGTILYPLLGMNLGHVYPGAPTFGAPCPTTIFTFGIFTLASRIPAFLLIVPALWSLVGFSAALTLGIAEDTGLLVAGVAGTLIVAMAKPAVPLKPADQFLDS